MHVSVDEHEAITLAPYGTPLGAVWGAIDATVRPSADGDRLDVDVRAPKLHVALPRATLRDVQSTERDPTIHFVGVKTVARPAPPSRELRVAVHLDDVVVARDTSMRVALTGDVVVDVGATMRITGKIEVRRGFVQVAGRTFRILGGSVDFTGRPADDPVVVARATYDAPDGTRVFVGFDGPVSSGTITLRSEPPLTRAEILAVLVFGSQEGTFGPSSTGSGVGAGELLGASVVAAALNQALRGASGGAVSARIETRAGVARPAVTIDLSDRVTATIRRNLGDPAPGQPPDPTLVTIDWRVAKGWSTAATFGDRGTSIVDVTWKHRY